MNIFTELKNYLSSWLRRFWLYLLGKTEIDEKIQEKVEDLKETVNAVKEEIKDVKEAVEETIEDAKDFAESAEKVVDEIKDVFDAVQDNSPE